MTNVEKYFDEIDVARIRRAKELSELKRAFAQFATTDMLGVSSKAVVVLTYANWEGFYNDCVNTYINFLRENGGKVRDRDWMLLVGALHADFESIKDRHYSFESRRQFIEKLRTKLDCGFDAVDIALISARSNLDFAQITRSYDLLGFDLSDLQAKRNHINKELVGWRHAVAHGDSPDLKTMDVNKHIDFTSQLLTLVSDRFQYSILERI